MAGIPRREPLIPQVERVSRDRPAGAGPTAGLDELEMVARLMDTAFEIPGLKIRFGLDALIGLFPAVGDAITSVISLFILSAATRYGVPRVTLARMGLNVALDAILGAIPVVGDLFDVAWKANVRNVALLRQHLEATPHEARRARRGDWLFVGAASLVVLGAIILAGWIAYWLMSSLYHLLAG